MIENPLSDYNMDDIDYLPSSKNRKYDELIKSIRKDLNRLEQAKIAVEIFRKSYKINQIVQNLEELQYWVRSFRKFSIKDVSKRLNIINDQLNCQDNKIKNLEEKIDYIEKRIDKNMILLPVVDINEAQRQFIDEEKKIEELKKKHEGEILAFTKRKGKLHLVAHSLYESELMSQISSKRKEKQLKPEDKIFYR